MASQAPDDNLLEPLTGSVERVTFHSDDTGFCVLRIKARGHRDLITVVGTAPNQSRSPVAPVGVENYINGFGKITEN